jgi:hypothetical protein
MIKLAVNIEFQFCRKFFAGFHGGNENLKSDDYRLKST